MPPHPSGPRSVGRSDAFSGRHESGGSREVRAKPPHPLRVFMQQRPSTPSTPTTTLRPAYATTAQSRLTRPKAATRRLLSLDYIIERPTLGWLQTENEKVPYRTYSEGKQVQKRFFTMKFPVAVDAKAATFAYVAGLTTEPHSRAAHEPSARRAGSRGFTAGFQAADLVTAGFNLRTRAALHTRARATESNSHRGRCFGRRRRSDTD